MIPQSPVLSTNYNHIYIVNSDSRTDIQKCLDRSDNEDIRNKTLKNEEFNDEEINRLNECTRKIKEESKQFTIAMAIFCIVVIILFVIACFCA